LEHRPPVRLKPAMHWVHTLALPVAHVVQLATEQAAGPVARVWGRTVNDDGQQRGGFVVTAGMGATQRDAPARKHNPLPSGLCSRLEHRPPVRLNPAMHWVHTVALPSTHLVQLATEQAAGPVARVVGADGQRRRSADARALALW
jgi:hypothetical protein